jgi:protein TonB
MDSMVNHPQWETRGGANRAAGVGVTVLLHGLVIAGLLYYQPTRSALEEAMPIMVNLITPTLEKTQQLPQPLPVKPRVQRHVAPPAQVVPPPATTPAPSPPALAPSPPAVAVAPAATASAPAAPASVPAAELAPSPPPVPVAVVPPNFSADYLDNPPPAYPSISRRMGEQGKVVLRVLVSAKGAPDKVELKSSSGSNRLDDTAVETVRHWRFVPARQGEEPVAAWVLVPITFTLKS